MTPDTGPQHNAPVALFTALVLAGERPGGDPLARAVGAPHKALIPVAGEAMLLRVVRALGAARHVGAIVVSGLPAPALASDAELGALLASGRIAQLDGRDTPSTSVLDATERLAGWAPLLVTTADHPLLRPEVIDYFCAAALASGGDVALGLVDGALVRAAFPESSAPSCASATAPIAGAISSPCSPPRPAGRQRPGARSNRSASGPGA